MWRYTLGLIRKTRERFHRFDVGYADYYIRNAVYADQAASEATAPEAQLRAQQLAEAYVNIHRDLLNEELDDAQRPKRVSYEPSRVPIWYPSVMDPG